MSDFARLVRSRRMVRAFATEPVLDDSLARVLAAGLAAPSAGHVQAVDLLVVDAPARYWEITLADREGFRWQGLLDAPVLVIPVVSPDAYAARYAEPDKRDTGLGDVEAWPVPYWWVDGGMAVEAMLLAAVAEGLGACFFGLFEHERAVLDAFGVPAGRRALGTVALGHPLPDTAGRSAARPKRHDRVHRGCW
jgi:nitroreductase